MGETKQMLNPRTPEDIYQHLKEYLLQTSQTKFATRWDMIHYCVGYFGYVTANHLTAIACLEKNGLIKK